RSDTRGFERTLKHYIWARDQSRACHFGVVAKFTTLDLDDAAPSSLEARQMGRLVSISLFLQQPCIFAVLPRFRPSAPHMCQIKGRRVCTAHEAHEIRGGQQYPAVQLSHEYFTADIN